MERKALMEIIQDDERIRFDDIAPVYLSDTLGRLKGSAAVCGGTRPFLSA